MITTVSHRTYDPHANDASGFPRNGAARLRAYPRLKALVYTLATLALACTAELEPAAPPASDAPHTLYVAIDTPGGHALFGAARAVRDAGGPSLTVRWGDCPHDWRTVAARRSGGVACARRDPLPPGASYDAGSVLGWLLDIPTHRDRGDGVVEPHPHPESSAWHEYGHLVGLGHDSPAPIMRAGAPITEHAYEGVWR